MQVQQQLDQKKDEFRQRMQRCQEKEVELAAKQAHPPLPCPAFLSPRDAVSVPRVVCALGPRYATKQEAIKEQVRKFDKFLKDNDAKRMRANRKVWYGHGHGHGCGHEHGHGHGYG